MNTDSVLYIDQLKTLTRTSSNAYVKKWAHLWLNEIAFQTKLITTSRETLNRLNNSYPSNPGKAAVTA